MSFAIMNRAHLRVLSYVLMSGVLSATAAAKQAGVAPTEAELDAPLGALPVAEAVVPRAEAQGFGGGTLYFPDRGGKHAAVVVVPGFTGYQSSVSWLGPRLASHGFVVFVIDTFTTSDQPDVRAKQLHAALRQIASLSKSKDSPIYGKVDTRRMAAMGHSMGGGAALLAAREDSELKAVVALTPWTQDRKFETASVPTLIVACEKDTIAVNATHSQPIYDSMPATLPKAYVELKGQTHFCPQTPPAYPLMGRYAIAWLKRYLDDDRRYDTFLCGDAHRAVTSGDQLSGQRNTCPF